VSVRFAAPLGLRVLKDGLLSVSFLLLLGGVVTACLRAIERVARFFSDRASARGKHRTISRGANR